MLGCIGTSDHRVIGYECYSKTCRINVSYDRYIIIGVIYSYSYWYVLVHYSCSYIKPLNESINPK